MRDFTHWATTPTPQGQPRWAVGRYGPRMIIQTDEEDTVRMVVDALNRMFEGFNPTNTTNEEN